MHHQHHKMVSPVLSNYLVPRHQRFRPQVFHTPQAPSDSYFSKKSEKTTNITEMPQVSSNLDSPEPFSLEHSINYDNPSRSKMKAYDTPNYHSRQRDSRSNGKYAGQYKSFKLDDYENTRNEEYIDDSDAQGHSFQTSYRDLQNVEYGDFRNRDFRHQDYKTNEMSDYQKMRIRNHPSDIQQNYEKYKRKLSSHHNL